MRTRLLALAGAVLGANLAVGAGQPTTSQTQAGYGQLKPGTVGIWDTGQK